MRGLLSRAECSCRSRSFHGESSLAVIVGSKATGMRTEPPIIAERRVSHFVPGKDGMSSHRPEFAFQRRWRRPSSSFGDQPNLSLDREAPSRQTLSALGCIRKPMDRIVLRQWAFLTTSYRGRTAHARKFQSCFQITTCPPATGHLGSRVPRWRPIPWIPQRSARSTPECRLATTQYRRPNSRSVNGDEAEGQRPSRANRRSSGPLFARLDSVPCMASPCPRR